MIRKVELGIIPRQPFAEPSPLGLIGLAIACAALLPMTLGFGLTPAGLKTASMFALLFGAGCQLLAGLMSFANHNLFGGTLFTAFSFNWLMNWWALRAAAEGVLPDRHIVLAVDLAMLIVFLVFTYGFGFFSKLLFVFLLDIDLLYAARLLKALLLEAGAPAVLRCCDLAIATLTALLALIALWLAFGALINVTAGRQLFKIPGPLFMAPRRQGYDWTLRYNIFDVLYRHWREHAFEELGLAELRARLRQAGVERDPLPDLCYLAEYGAVQLDDGRQDAGAATSRGVRLTAGGIDLFEQLVLKKYDFA